MEKRRAAILTCYTANRNYGGLLQAYALQRVIEERTGSCAVLQYRVNRKKYIWNRICGLGLEKTFHILKTKIISKLHMCEKEYREGIKRRNAKFDTFEKMIPHSKAYSDETIECKNVMLVSTYLKTIFADKVLLLINLISVLMSLGFTVLTVYVLESIELAVLSMLISLMLRCVLGELYLGRKLDMHVWKHVWQEGLLVALFILCNWYLGSIGMVLYAISFTAFCITSQRELREIYQFVKGSAHLLR